MSFIFTPSDLFPEVVKISGNKFQDERGFFCESFREKDLLDNNFPRFVQENHSFSKGGTIRGLHYQLNPRAQGKLVYCVSGQIWDYIVDIRKESSTYKKWTKYCLDSNSNQINILYIPIGFAHGFYVPLGSNAHIIYKVTEYYSPEHERTIRWNDPDINIKWQGNCIRISDRDKNAPLLRDAENNF